MKMQCELLPLIVCLCVTAADGIAQAQSIRAAPDGTGTIVTPAAAQIEIRGGTQLGSNLFHSFDRFNVQQHQTANFLVNPDIQTILSRVVGGDPSHINGLLQVTGSRANLYLMNPAGIVFGAGAQLNVPGSFTATTANAIGFGCGSVHCDGWFPATGPIPFSNLTETPNSFAFLTNQPGAIFNAGMLSVSPGQSLTLLGGTVINTGTLTAPGGTIAIMAVPGERFVRVHETGQLLSLDLPLETRNTLTAVTQPFDAIALPQLLTGGAVAGATGVTVENGIVRLTSSNTTLATHPGSVAVSGSVSVGSPTAPGGMMQILGDRLALHSAHLDASGTEGGKIFIGGDYQGKGSIPNAQFTLVDQGSTITADGISTVNSPVANGGRIILWSDDTTQFAGNISAQAGAWGGNGGFVETSGKLALRIAPTATVTTTAPKGQLGTWLLDPTDLAVVATGGTGSISGGTNSIPDSTIDAGVVVTALNGSNVTLQATNSISVNALIDATANSSQGNLTLQAPTVNLNLPILLKSGSTLNGTATTVNVGAAGSVQNAVDVATSGAAIAFAPTTYTLTQQVKLDKNLSLTGTTGTTFLGSGKERIFQIDSGRTVSMNYLTIASGAAPEGGGIYNTGSLTLNHSTLIGNQANQGGGIYNTGSLTLNNSTIVSNYAVRGGGIYNAGFFTSNNSFMIGNGAANRGGGIYNAGFFTSNNSAIANNQASNQGGGVYNIGYSTLNNSFVTSNQAGNSGPGIYSIGFLTLDNNIITNNQILRQNSNTTSISRANDRLVERNVNGGLDNAVLSRLGNRVQSSQIVNRDWAANDRAAKESFLSIPTLTVNSQTNEELAIAAVDGEFSDAYKQHFGLVETNAVNLVQLQTTLAQLKQKRGIRSALIYASFVPRSNPSVHNGPTVARPDDQLQLILVRSSGEPIIRRVSVSRSEVVSQAKLFRLAVSDPEDSRSFVPIARQLYDWLLTPIKAELQAEQVTNLVFSLDEGLRTIPIAALMQQDQFLIEQYSLSVIPSAALANLDITPPDTSRILAMGADRFSAKNPLPAVPLELQAISRQIPNPAIALNEAFTLDNLLRSQQQGHPEMLHLATHAEFNSGSPDRSYIQFWNTKLTLNQIKSLNWKAMNLTLLTLSACTTAISSREAELGFAGLAVVSGVRSTLGSLWLVSDIGTFALMNEFYGHLKTSKTLSAALQTAQLSLLRGTTQIDPVMLRSLQQKQLLPASTTIQPTQFSHPFYWSAFTLVGNPW